MCYRLTAQLPQEWCVGDGAHGSDGAALAECKAQRAVYLVGGTGGFAWFSLIWPLPAVITGFQAAYAYDNPANAKDLTVEVAHPLYARKVGVRGLWEGTGRDPQPSAFVAGSNETHTQIPSSILNAGGSVPAAGASLQVALHPVIPVMVFSPAGPYGALAGAPAATNVATVDAAITAFDGKISADVQQQLRPTAAQLTRYLPAGSGAAASEVDLATKLAYTANAFRLGLIGTVMMSAFNDDPHGAFASGIVPQRASDLYAALDAFYADLAASAETTCGHAGGALSLADNVVMVVDGDTPKSSFANNGWPDGTINNSNWFYVRSNGFTRPGWFGQITSAARSNFSPSTGLVDANASNAASTAAAVAGTLYAIARGDKAAVTTFTSAPFDGVILH